MTLPGAGDLTLQEHSGQTGTLLLVRSTTLLLSNLQSDSRAEEQNTNRGIYLIVRLTANKLQCKRGRRVSSSKSGCCGFSNVSSASTLLAAFHKVWLPGSLHGPQPSRPLVLGFWATAKETSVVLQAASSLVWTSAPMAWLSLRCLLYTGLAFLWGKTLGEVQITWNPWAELRLCSDGGLDLQSDFAQPSLIQCAICEHCFS